MAIKLYKCTIGEICYITVRFMENINHRTSGIYTDAELGARYNNRECIWNSYFYTCIGQTRLVREYKLIQSQFVNIALWGKSKVFIG